MVNPVDPLAVLQSESDSMIQRIREAHPESLHGNVPRQGASFITGQAIKSSIGALGSGLVKGINEVCDAVNKSMVCEKGLSLAGRGVEYVAGKVPHGLSALNRVKRVWGSPACHISRKGLWAVANTAFSVFKTLTETGIRFIPGSKRVVSILKEIRQSASTVAVVLLAMSIFRILGSIPGAGIVKAPIEYGAKAAVDASAWAVVQIIYAAVVNVLEPALNAGSSAVNEFINAPVQLASSVLSKVASVVLSVGVRGAATFFWELNWVGKLLTGYYVYTFFPKEKLPDLTTRYRKVTPLTVVLGGITARLRAFFKGKVEFCRDNLGFGDKLYQYFFPYRVAPVFNKKIDELFSFFSQWIQKVKNEGEGGFANLLLEGPPGTGKTMIAEKIAIDSGCNYIAMSGAHLMSEIDGKQGKRLKEILNFGAPGFKMKLFSWATWGLTFGKYAYRPRPLVLFIDEIDAFLEARARKRESLGRNLAREELLAEFLAFTGSPRSDVMIIGATNRKGMLDSAALSRFSRVVYVGNPDTDSREKMVEEYVKAQFTSRKERAVREKVFTPKIMRRIASQTAGFSGRSIEGLIRYLRNLNYCLSTSLTPERINQATYEYVVTNRSYEEASSNWLSRKVTGIKNGIADTWNFGFAARSA
ncbi:MAG: hypothetical protein RLZZ453_482 [Chlamydiota bacterium]|jgi:hypothetical protein